MSHQESVSIPPVSNEVHRPQESAADAQNSPLRTIEDFNGYCQQVQSRLAEHAARRKYFLQAAHDRLTQLLYTARAVGDQALYKELWQHRATARELLDALQRANPNGSVQPPRTNGYTSDRSDRLPFVSQPAPPHPQQPLSAFREAAEAVAESLVEQGVHSSPEPRLPRRPARPVSDIEADAARLRETLKGWAEKWPLVRTEKDELNVPNCLRLRAVACRQRRLEEEAGDTEIAEVIELGKDVVALLDEAGDEEYTVALDDDLNPPPTSFQWSELAQRYEDMAQAQEAFEWWVAHRNRLAVADSQPLAEAIAACQQRFNRLLFRVGSRDPFQQALFDELRHWAREAQCFLHSLRPKVPNDELAERAATLGPSWQGARETVESAGE